MVGEGRALRTRLYLAMRCCLLVALLWGTVKEGYGQDPMKRQYAILEFSGGSLLRFVTTPGAAVDGNPSTYSTIGVTLVGDVWQRLEFPNNLSAGTTIRVKIGTSGDILSLLGNIQIQAYQNSTSRGNPVSIGNLISLLAGEDQAEIVFTPTESFNSVRIYSSGVALGGGLKIYDAYYLIPATNQIACDVPADILYGSTGSIAGGLNAIENASKAIDNDLTSFAVMRANVSAVGNRTHITALYNTISSMNDSIRIVLRHPGTLLNATILSDNLRIRTLLDNTDNGYLLLDPQLLSLRLLASGSNIQVLTYPIDALFNRIEISLGGGLADALTSLDVFEISRIMAKPTVTALNIEDDHVTICEGEMTTLSVENPAVGYDYFWYATGNTPIYTGSAYTVVATEAGTFTYYVSKSRDGCTEESDKAKVVVSVSPIPGKPHLTISDVIN